MAILQININSLNNSINKTELELILNKEDIQIACIQETWLLPKQELIIKDYNIYRKDREDGYGGVAIACKNNLRTRLIEFDTWLETVIVETMINSKKIVIASIYMTNPINGKTPKDTQYELEYLIEFLDTFENSLIMGDFNGKSSMWGNDINDGRGKIIEESIITSNFRLLNTGQSTHFTVDKEKIKFSAIDLTFNNNIQTNWIWKVLDRQIGGSHHFPIMIINQERINTKNKSKCNKNVFSINKYQKIINEIPWENDSQNFEINILKSIKEATINIDTNKNRYKPKVWWDSELSRLHRRKNAATNRFRKFPIKDNLNILNEISEEFKKCMNEKKEKSWNDLLEELSNNKDQKSVWSTINRIKGGKKKNIQQINDTLKEQFLSSLTENRVIINERRVEHNNTQFNLDELNNVLKKKSVKSAPGIDKISYRHLKSLNGTGIAQLLEHLNKIWEKGELDDKLRTIKILPILKPNKDPDLISSYRPISLIPVFTKLINSMVKENIVSFIEKEKILPERSYGFRKHRSAMICTNDMMQEVNKAIERKKKIILISIDLENAFNKVCVKKLYNILNEILLPEHLKNWCIQFLEKRILKIDKMEKTTSTGLPQGSVLSPTLFNIYTKSLHNINNDGTKTFQFADDFAIVIENENIRKAEIDAQLALRKFNKICTELKININWNKTNCMAIKSRTELNITIDNINVRQTTSTKILGRFINANLKDTLHIKETKEKANKNNRIVQILNGIKKGIHPKKGIQLAKAIVFSKIEYGISSLTLKAKSNTQALAVPQNAIIRKCLGVPKSTPNHTLYVMADMWPINLRAEWLTAKEILKIKYFDFPAWSNINPNSQHQTAYDKTYRKYKEIIDQTLMEKKGTNCVKLFIRTDFFNKNTSKQKHSRSEIQWLFRMMMYQYKNWTVIGTDGSLKDNVGGFAYCSENPRIEELYKIPMKTSSLTVETLAIKQAIQKFSNVNTGKILILTDSLNACLNLKNNMDNRGIEIKEMINQSNLRIVEIVWIPAHSGIKINEKADKLAKQAVETGIDYNPELSMKDALILIKDEINKEWNETYKTISQTKGKTYFKVHKEAAKRPWFWNVKWPAYYIKIINRLITGHTYAKCHLKKWKVVETELCEICNEVENENHILFQCKKLEEDRRNIDIFAKYNTLEEICLSKNLDDLKTLADYIIKNKLRL